MISTDSLWLSMHEAGHLVAATMRGVSWDYATIVPVSSYAGHVSFRPDDAYLDEANQAFIYWAGPYAQAKCTNTPLDVVLRSESSSFDREVFGPFRSPANDRLWAEELDAAWDQVRDCAARLLLVPLLLPDTPDPLQDAALVATFVANLTHPDVEPVLITSTRSTASALGLLHP